MRDQIIKNTKSKIGAAEGNSQAAGMRSKEDKLSIEYNLINDLIDDRLLSLEQMLDVGADLTLQLEELRELRQLCFSLRALVHKVPGLPEWLPFAQGTKGKNHMPVCWWAIRGNFYCETEAGTAEPFSVPSSP